MSNKLEATYGPMSATFHPHPSYAAMEAAWNPVRREQARQALAQSIDKYTRPTRSSK